MDNTHRYRTSLGRISSFATQPEPDPSQHNSRTGHYKELASLSRPWASPSFRHSALRQDHLRFVGDEEVPLDAFDKELLAAEEGHPVLEQQWQASRHHARISLPSTLTATPAHSGSQELRDDLYKTPVSGEGASSSSTSLVSSPTVHVAKQREQQRSLNRNKTAVLEALISPEHTCPPLTRLEVGQAPPIVQGIRLVPATDLPDRFRCLFPYPLFNAVQSKSYPIAFHSDDNMVLSAPTGSGKTVIMELAICRLMASHRDEQYKVVYQAPTKSLCSERFQDWQTKFGALDLQCAELTGDTDYNQLRSVQNARIIITTPEKWDSITRKWKDRSKLMQLVRLFLIDEVHVLKDSRGATLEAVVSRMKSVASTVRFIALSATVPNSEDIASWLGKCANAQHLPAHREVFGEEFRPVQLQKFVYGYGIKQNDFAFDSVLTNKLPEIIAKHSNRKPIMIFCFTRTSAIKTSKSLADLWTATNTTDRLWPTPGRRIQVMEPELRQVTLAGVAFHHAGLDIADRRAVEEGFLNGNINIICCTSTLAVGVNLPCYLVIIKGTISWAENGVQEYADLEMMQMLGRAGRPQFETSACAVILTRDEKVNHYQNMVSGKEPLESSLHLNLIDHLNAEIGLGTISDGSSAEKWLAGTFLSVRLKRNPNHYKLKGKDSARPWDEHELLQQICDKDLRLLQSIDLVSSDGRLKCTEFGDAMARYCIKFETMKIILSLPPKAKMSEILSVLAQANEYHDIRMKAGERTLFKEINKDVGIKFPIKVDVALPAHKILLLIQAELGGVEFPATDAYKKHKQQYQQDKGIIFQHVNRLIRCIIDCQLHFQDSVSARHALELGRSLAARAWDSSPLQLKQLEQIGNVAVRKLAGAGINSMEILENTEPQRIEAVLQKNPPFGMKLLSKLENFPKLRVSAKQIGKESKVGAFVEARIEATVGFLNEKVPLYFNQKPIYVCFMAETSDGKIIDFRRIHAKRLQTEHEIRIQANLSKPTTHIACHVMCDEVAGTNRRAEIKLEHIATRLFPPIHHFNQEGKSVIRSGVSPATRNLKPGGQLLEGADDFGDGSLEDDDLLATEILGGVEVMDVDNLFMEDSSITEINQSHMKYTGDNRKFKNELPNQIPAKPMRLENGKWACNHTCKKENKNCKHKCCNEGLDRPRKPPQKKMNHDFEKENDTTDHPVPNPRKHKNPFEAAQSVSEENRSGQQETGALDTQRLEKRHKASGTPNSLAMFTKDKLGDQHHQKDSAPNLQSFAENPYGLSGLYKTEYLDDVEFEDLPMPKDLFGGCRSVVYVEGSLNEGKKIPLDAVDEDLVIEGNEENELYNLVAGRVDFDDAMTLANGSDDYTRCIDDMDALGGTQSFSKPLENLSSSKPQSTVTLGTLDIEDDMGFFQTPLAHVAPQSLRKRSNYDNNSTSSELSKNLKEGTEKGLFISGECSSPLNLIGPRDEPSCEQTASATCAFGDEQGLYTSLAKRMDSDLDTPRGDEVPFISLRDITNPYRRLKDIQSIAGEEHGPENEQGAMKPKGETDEEKQKRLWADIDPAIYAEFHEIVELVED